jgi:TolB-like protein/tetratricopeptide (TPR) repeat protein
MAERNADTPEDRRIVFRIGVNLGDVIVQDDDVFGDGVNVAARLEGLAEPGGICVSRPAHDQVRNKVELDFDYMGEQVVKNIAEPVFAYRAVLEPGGEKSVAPPGRKTGRVRAITGGAALAAIVAIGLGEAWYAIRPAPPSDTAAGTEKSMPVSEQAASLALPDTPSIAVLPFANMSGDAEQEYFSDGITEDLITDLSKIRGLFVVARNSTFAYKGRSTEIRRVGRELGVRYVLEGSVRKAGGQVRINAQLIDAVSGGHLWADRYDGDLKNVFALQDKITAEIVTAMTAALGARDGIAPAAGQSAPEALALEPRTGTRGKTASAAAYDQYLQGWSFFHKRTPQDFVTSVSHFNRALEHDPGYALAHVALASVYWESWKRYWQRHLGLGGNYAAWEQADKHLELALESPSPMSHRIKSEMLFINRRFDKAIAEAERAIALNPNDALGYVVLAEAKTFAGQASEAVPLIEKAMRLDPHSPPSYLYSMGVVHFGLAQYGKAAAFLERAVAKNAQDPLWYVLLIASYGHLNETEKARSANARLVELQEAAGLQRFSVNWPHGRWPFKNKKDQNRLKQGMLAGGLPVY